MNYKKLFSSVLFATFLLFSPVRSWGGVSYSGDADYINVGDVAAYDFSSGDFSIATWFRTDDSTNDFQFMATKANGNNSVGGWEFYYRGAAGTDFVCLFRTGATSHTTAINMSTAVANDTWYHIVCVFDDSADTFDMYVTTLGSSTIENEGDTGETGNPLANTRDINLGTRDGSGTEDVQGDLNEMYF